jgi:ribosomal protein L11 methyltransferase
LKPKAGTPDLAAKRAEIWALEIVLPERSVCQAEEALAPLGYSTSWFETRDGWRLQVLTLRPPQSREVQRALALAKAALGEPLPPVTLRRSVARDWVSHSNRLRRPLRVGRFFLYEPEHAKLRPSHLLPIVVEAGRAFGTGRAPSTLGCLTAIDAIAKRMTIRSALDLGTGSGVLAIALTRASRAMALAVDNDPVAVEVAEANIAANGLRTRARAILADGCRHHAIAAHAPFDLIVANILAEPLKRLARPMARHLHARGSLVLSGLLSREGQAALAVYRGFGFRLRRRIEINGWVTLVLDRLASLDLAQCAALFADGEDDANP